MAAITFNRSLEARRAEKEGVTSLYAVTTNRDFLLHYHDIFRYERTGKIFRVTSDSGNVRTPPMATFQFSQATAEEWELTE